MFKSLQQRTLSLLDSHARREQIICKIRSILPGGYSQEAVSRALRLSQANPDVVYESLLHNRKTIAYEQFLQYLGAKK